MSTTMRDTAHRPSASGLNPGGVAGRTGLRRSSGLSRIRRRVSLWPLLAGFLIIFIAVVGITGLLAERGAVTTIWVAASEIEADAPMEPGQLSTVSVSGEVAFDHYPVSEVSREAVLAAVPRVDIPAGTPLSAAHFYDGAGPAAVEAGTLTVAVVVGSEHLPVNLQRGDHVLLVGVPESSRPEAAAQGWPGSAPILQDAAVVAVSDSPTASDVTVTVAVPRDIVDDVAWLAGQKRLVIARDR